MTTLQVPAADGGLFTYDLSTRPADNGRPICPDATCGQPMRPAGDQVYQCDHQRNSRPYPDLPRDHTPQPQHTPPQTMRSPFRGLVDVPLPPDPVGAGMNARKPKTKKRSNP